MSNHGSAVTTAWRYYHIYSYVVALTYLFLLVHLGGDYNEDAKYFTGFLVWLLEEGRKKYGNKQVCVILDRSTIVFAGGYLKKETFDLGKVSIAKSICSYLFMLVARLGIIPKLVELFTTIYSTISLNYPDVLYELKIFPTSWFFSACYRITSRIFDSHTRNKFKIIQEVWFIHSILIYPRYTKAYTYSLTHSEMYITICEKHFPLSWFLLISVETIIN